MILYYEVYEKGTNWEGSFFRTLEEVNEYIKGQTFLSPRMYQHGKTEDDYEVIPHSYTSPEDWLRDEYGDNEYDYYEKQIELGVISP